MSESYDLLELLEKWRIAHTLNPKSTKHCVCANLNPSSELNIVGNHKNYGTRALTGVPYMLFFLICKRYSQDELDGCFSAVF